jgi:hypothetical protein
MRRCERRSVTLSILMAVTILAIFFSSKQSVGKDISLGAVEFESSSSLYGMHLFRDGGHIDARGKAHDEPFNMNVAENINISKFHPHKKKPHTRINVAVFVLRKGSVKRLVSTEFSSSRYRHWPRDAFNIIVWDLGKYFIDSVFQNKIGHYSSCPTCIVGSINDASN